MQMALTWVTSRVTILRSVNKIHIKQLLLCLRWNVKPGRQLKWTLIFFLPRAITYLAFSSTIHKTMIACPGILHTIKSNTDIYWGILEGKFELLLNLTFPTFKSYIGKGTACPARMLSLLQRTNYSNYPFPFQYNCRCLQKQAASLFLYIYVVT